MILYLHGFTSGPQSRKVQALASRMAQHGIADRLLCPQLPASPAAAIALAADRLGKVGAGGTAVTLVGSSLGGFYATWLAGRRGCKLVVLNPAVDPARDLAAHIGEQSAWHDPAERFFFRPDYVEELRALRTGPPVRSCDM